MQLTSPLLQLLAYLMVTSFSSVAEFLYLAYNGDREVSWSEACSYYGKFCGRAAASFAFHVIILLCFCALSPLSAYRYFSRFEAPSSP
ncbi:hypothetical protein QJS04_geneDACA018255 [Acorus gramineus]|uniref:CASP-like protein n=1 Tax=Acorus gramineus TaxID=55184 RepID=A0AAV9BQW6_ACOGR|nr:hypothetical protein QJS04_geneDACA018255 [Acorus gramineus]